MDKRCASYKDFITPQTKTTLKTKKKTQSAREQKNKTNLIAIT